MHVMPTRFETRQIEGLSRPQISQEKKRGLVLLNFHNYLQLRKYLLQRELFWVRLVLGDHYSSFWLCATGVYVLGQ